MPKEGRGGEEVVRELELALLHSSRSAEPLDHRQEGRQPRTPWAPSGLPGEAAACWEALLTGSLPSLSWQGSRWPPAPLRYCQATKLCHLVKLYSAGSSYRYTS